MDTRPSSDASPPEDYPSLDAIPPKDYNAKTMLVSIPLLSKPKETIQNVYELRTQREMVRYYHAAAGFPVKAMWVKAIADNQYASWSGLTVEAAERYFPESLETQKGHMRKQKAGIRSTKKRLLSELLDAGNTPAFMSKQRDITVQIFDTNNELAMTVFTVQTG